MSRPTSLLSILAVLVAGGTALAEPITPQEVAHAQFKFDSSKLEPGAEAALAKVASKVRTNPDQRIVLSGFTDPIGTAPYNVGLAIRRAKAVEDALEAQGVPAATIVINAFGEAGPRLAGYAPNRRVTVSLSSEPIASDIDKTFAEGGTSVTWGRPMTTAELEAAPTPVASR
jgi:outer membrane protein OmpA-like peptidoglycan-associated protein